MTRVDVVGGVYHERCIWPDWDQLWGSGGRGAAVIAGYGHDVELHAYATDPAAAQFDAYSQTYGFKFRATPASQTISFDYLHALASPTIRPGLGAIRSHSPIEVTAEVALRFGMMEGSGKVRAKRCVYDPQSAFSPERFGANGSTAEHLAIVANGQELSAMTGNADPRAAARALLSSGVDVVVAKLGPAGAYVITNSGEAQVTAFLTSRVWSVGSGDVFAATFAALWGAEGCDAVEAATVSSRAVAAYVDTLSLPTPPRAELEARYSTPAIRRPGRVYLASPFFTMGERWLVDEARRCLIDLGLDVFSPVHDVGPGPAKEVAPKDIAEIKKCDAMFAILDGIDCGTVFEIGYARALEKPVYVLAQTIGDEDLKMIDGSNCRVFDDLVSALHNVAWRT